MTTTLETKQGLRTVFCCRGTGCQSSHSDRIQANLQDEAARLGIADRVKIDFSGCHGFCQRGPIVVVEPEGVLYTKVKPEDAVEIAREHLAEGRIVDRLLYRHPYTGEAMPYYKDVMFYRGQTRLVLASCGLINPERIQDYIEIGGYQALRKALLEMTPEKVIEEVKKSGLRGRGGAGFPTGNKWEFAHNASGTQKYMIVNADEGDPGAFMDRSLLEANPHQLIEGMAIGGYAIGASEGYIYCRAEYPLAVQRLIKAIAQAEEQGCLGTNIFGSKFSFTVHLKEGSGAFVCGEETALMASIEGRRGMPRPRPPFPANSGLWAKPSNINNVKTLSTVPLIIKHGAEWFSKYGTEKSKGTVIFALTGKIVNSGLVEIPMGTTMRQIIYDIGGGIPNGKRFKAAQTGGPSGGCLPPSFLDTPVDFESLAAAGSMMGSGGLIIGDEDTCMVDLARFFMAFCQSESCGKCVPCRVGTRQMLAILERITRGEGQEGDIERLLELADNVKNGSLCALGQTAPNPVVTTIRHFRDEYEMHIKKKRCPAVLCKQIIKAPCRGACPAGVDVPRYVRLIHQGKFAEALAVNRERIPFPAVCGRVCFHPCEFKCRRGQVDQAIAIRMLKRSAADRDSGGWKDFSRVAPPTEKKVALIGSGPASLTAAYYLAKLGHKCTVFETQPVAGGGMRICIPDYRLPPEVLEQEIQVIRDVGVEIKTDTRVESIDKVPQGFDAVFVGAGAHGGMKIGIPGEDTPGVMECIHFLRDVNEGHEVKVGKRVAVIGGGNAAVDAARVSRRLGAAEVTMLYRRTKAEMPAEDIEIEAALEEAVRIQELTAPLKITREGDVLKLQCQRNELGAVDASGRRRPVPVKGSEFTIELDTIIAAIGEVVEIGPEMGLDLEKNGAVKADVYTLATSRRGVFAGGDVITGPASVINAIGAGREAAVSIDKFLGGKGNIAEVLLPPQEGMDRHEAAPGGTLRYKMPHIPVEGRLTGFTEVELGFPEDVAKAEAGRCLCCDLEEY